MLLQSVISMWMFTITDMTGSAYTVKLVRIKNIMVNGAFSQSKYATETPVFEYAVPNTSAEQIDKRRECAWSTTETPLISI